MKLVKNLLLLTLVLLFIFVGFYRTTFTDSIANFFSTLFTNPQFTQTHYQQNNLFSFFFAWADTILYSFIHSILILLIISIVFGNKRLTLGAVVLLVFLLFSCFLLILVYKITHINLFYRFSEDLIYIVLSPTPLLLLLFIGFLLPFTNGKTKK